MAAPESIERERRWAPWAGPIGIGAFLTYLAGNVVAASTDVYTAETSAEQLRNLEAGSTGFVAAAALQAVGFAGLATLMWLLFRAARARWPQMNGSLLGLTVIGPGLFVALSIINVIGFDRSASEYTSLGEPQVRNGPAAVEEFSDTVENEPGSIDEALFLTDADVVEYEPKARSVVSLAYPADDEQELIDAVEATDIDTETETEGEAGELAARNTLAESDALNTARILYFPAALALVIAMFYTARSAMRVGLQTRFWGTFGMAAAIAAILLGPIGPIIWMIWAVNVGLVMSGWPRSSRLAAWESGEAVPWPGRGEERAPEPESDPGQLPQPAEDDRDDPADPPTRKRKRKKRR